MIYRTTLRRNPDAKSTPEERRNLPSSRGNRSRWGVILLFVVYLVWFFSQPGSLAPSRLEDLVGLLLPEELLQATLGGGAEHLKFGVLDRVPILLAALVWLSLGFWIGKPLIIPLRSMVSRTECFCLSTLIGLSLLSTTTLLVGLAGFLHGRWLIVPILLLCSISFAAQTYLQRRWKEQVALDPSENDVQPDCAVVQDFEPESQSARWLWRMCQVTTFALAAAYLLGAVMPPFEFDVVEYHLQGPKEFYQSGRIGFIPHNVYLNMPLGSEMHSLAAMVLIGGDDGWWLGALVGKLVIGFFSLITAALAAGIAARNFGTLAGWASAALILATPGNIHIAGCGLVDSVLSAYLLATALAVHCLAKVAFRLCPASNEQLDEPLIIANQNLLRQALIVGTMSVSLLAGAAFACKYTGFVYLWLPATVVSSWLYLIATGQRKWIAFTHIAFIFLLGLALTAGPWLAKNVVYAGNPVFPLAGRWFGNNAPQWSSQQSDRWHLAHRVPSGPTIPGWESATAYGLNSLLGGLHKIFVGSPALPPALMPLAVLGLILGLVSIVRRDLRHPDSRTSHQWADRHVWRRLLGHSIAIPACLAVWVLVVWWLFTHRIDRFWLPVMPLLAVIAGLGFGWTRKHCGLRVAAGLILLCNVYGLYLSLSGTLCDQRWFVSLDSLRTDHGTDEQPGRIPKTTAWVNQNLSQDSRLLLIGEARVFDFQPHIEYATCFNNPPGMQGLMGKTAAQQRDWLKQNKTTHLLIHWREISRYRSPGNYGFSAWPSQQDIEELLSSGVMQPVEKWPFDSAEVILLKTKSD